MGNSAEEQFSKNLKAKYRKPLYYILGIFGFLILWDLVFPSKHESFDEYMNRKHHRELQKTLDDEKRFELKQRYEENKQIQEMYHQSNVEQEKANLTSDPIKKSQYEANSRMYKKAADGAVKIQVYKDQNK